jgi:integrase
LIEKYFAAADLDVQTLRGYKSKHKMHISPLIGTLPLSRLDIEVLDSFYAQLRTCRDHCRGRKYVQHRTTRPHQCDEHEGGAMSAKRPRGLPTVPPHLQGACLQATE